jgi:phosphoribosylamine--glycine ligase
MNILLVGAGGREHALAWKMTQSKRLTKLYVVPGNAGTAAIAENIPLSVNDFEGIGKLCVEKSIAMVVVGPEEPLVNGLAEHFQHTESLQHIKFIGPGKDGAKLEGSKDWAKQFMQKYQIPTAKAQSFTQASYQQGCDYLKQLQPPYVLKADGLAAGKGVLIVDDYETACGKLKVMLDGQFGYASATVLIEEFLSGTELSVFALTDGKNYILLPEAKDYKRIGEGDTGLNTGGMGAVSPVPFADAAYMQQVRERIIEPTIQGLQQENIHYCGFIFFGLINVSGQPMVIEYNCRLGDPETQAILPRLQADLVELFEQAANRQLAQAQVNISEQAAVAVVAVSGGYPEAYEKNKVVSGLTEHSEGVHVFQAGTAIDDNGQVITSGGRVLAITALAATTAAACAKAYEHLPKVSFEKMVVRRDVGKDVIPT